jgi:nitric oxide reductase large subunit
MLFIIIPLAVVFLGMRVYFALSGSTPRIVRIAALIALGAVILSVLVCGIIIMLSLGEGSSEPAMPEFLIQEQAAPPVKSNLLPMAILAVFLLSFLALVVFLSLREQRKSLQRASPRAPVEDSEDPGGV